MKGGVGRGGIDRKEGGSHDGHIIGQMVGMVIQLAPIPPTLLLLRTYLILYLPHDAEYLSLSLSLPLATCLVS